MKSTLESMKKMNRMTQIQDYSPNREFLEGEILMPRSGMERSGNGVWWAQPTALLNPGFVDVCTLLSRGSAHPSGAGAEHLEAAAAPLARRH